MSFTIIIWILVFFGIFYFLAIRPQRRQKQQHAEMVGMLKKGDEVVTIGGMFGTISAIQGYPGLGGAALGPVLTGWMYDRSGSYHLTFAVVASLYVLGAGAMFATPKPRPSTRD